MPLFRSSDSSQQSAPPPAEAPPTSRSGFFSRDRRAESPDNTNNYNHPANGNASVRSGSIRSGGFFGRRRSSSSDSSGDAMDLKHDPSIVAARQKVTDAEAAESAADRALNEARAAVRAAKEHVKMLEQEALAE